MVRYLCEIGMTSQAYATFIKNPHDRGQAVRPMFEAVGGKLEEFYFAVGFNTVYVIAQFPDVVSAHALTMAAHAGGAATSYKATAILTSAEAVEAMKKASEAGYRPPA